MKIKLYPFFYVISFFIITTSCSKATNYSTNVEVIRDWNFNLTSSNESNIIAELGAMAVFHLVVQADNTIRYEVKLDSASDRILTTQIRISDPVTDGPLMLDLPIRVYSNYASGILTGLNQSTIDSLLNNNIDKYINVTSERAPAGIVRGSLNSNVVFSKNVVLTGSAVVPAAPTNTTATALLRLTSDNILYSKVIVTNNDSADPVTSATLNQGVETTNGPVVFTLAASAQDFGVAKKSTISPAVYSTILGNSTYVTINSTLHNTGKLRGQVK